MKKAEWTLITLLATFVCGATHAGNMDAEMASWWKSSFQNTTDPQVIEGQSARYLTLGGISTRTNITQMPSLVTIQTPKLSAGCGGIDYFAGGFSAINADEFVNNLRAIGQNAQSLAYIAAIKIVSPLISSSMEVVQGWADKAKALNKDSCQVAAKLVGGSLNAMGIKQFNCIFKHMEEFGGDWAQAENACTTKGKIRTIEGSGDANKVGFVKGNLAWYTLMGDPYFRNNTELATIMMNLTGTLITTQKPGSSDVGISSMPLPAALEEGIEKERFKRIYDAFLYGKEQVKSYSVYQCKPVSTSRIGCITISSDPVKVNTSWKGIYEETKDLVSGIITNIRNDNPLTSEQEALVTSIKLPLLRYLSVISASPGLTGQAESLAQNYTELIAKEIVNRNLLDILGRIEYDLVNLPNNLIDTDRAKRYLKSLKGTMRVIQEKQKADKIDINKLFEMHDRIQAWEKAVIASFDPRMRSVVLHSFSNH